MLSSYEFTGLQQTNGSMLDGKKVTVVFVLGESLSTAQFGFILELIMSSKLFVGTMGYFFQEISMGIFLLVFEFKGVSKASLLTQWIVQVDQAVERVHSVQILLNTLGSPISVLVIFFVQKSNRALKMGMPYMHQLSGDSFLEYLPRILNTITYLCRY